MDKFTLVCLLIALVGFAIIYYSSVNLKPKMISIKEITPDLVGHRVWISGKIVSASYSKKGHVFLKLADNTSAIEIPIFYSLYKALGKPKFKKGQALSVSGFVDPYKGKLQVVPRKPEDIKVIK